MNEALVSLKTSEEFLAMLRAAGQRKLTAEEVFEQRVSWAYSARGRCSTLTRDQVRELLLRQDGGALSGKPA